MAVSEGWQEALAVLEPLELQLDAALAAGDVQAALRLAFAGASEAVRLVSETATGLTSVHKLLVELTPLPLAAYEDGTLGENGTHVNLSHHRWDVAPEEAAVLAGSLNNGAHWPLDSS